MVQSNMHSIETALGILNVDLSWAIDTMLLAHDSVQCQACDNKGQQLILWGLVLNAFQYHHIFNLRWVYWDVTLS